MPSGGAPCADPHTRRPPVTTPDQPTDPYREQPGTGGTGDGDRPTWDQPGAGSGAPGYGTADPYPAPQPSGPQQPYGSADPYAAQQPYGQQPYGAGDPYAQQPYGAGDPYAAQQPYGQQPGYGQDPYAGAYPAAPYGGYPGGSYVPVYGYPRNSLGVWSLALGIASFVCFGPLAGIPAIITGVLGRKAAQRGEANNGGLSLAGIILGALGCAVWVLGFVAGFADAFTGTSGYSGY
jgi:hypothetical protein